MKSFDVTNIARQEFNGDGVLSLAFATVDGRFGDLEYFASKEFDTAKAFRLELTIDQTGSAVPLPGSLSLAAVGLVAAAVAMKRAGARHDGN